MNRRFKLIRTALIFTALLFINLKCAGGSRSPAAVIASFFAAPEKISVETTEGVVVGEKRGDLFVFKGIPYAAPPIGPLRFKPPQPHAPWTTSREATSYGAKCLQLPPMGYYRLIEGSEDCLFLNIWRPAVSPARALPVMVWIHGGGNFFGSGNDSLLGGELYNGQHLALDGPAVVVTLNYRLGPMGFLAHPSLSRESGYNGSGNYAILDQIAAIKWVKENAAVFGGDPSNITVFGQSAGAIDTTILLASPLARGLFAKAILQSALMTDWPLSVSEANGVKLAKDLGCESAANPADCLRGLSAEKIIRTAYPSTEVLTSYQSSPTIDGHVLTEPVIDTLRRGISVPLLLGTNADELTTFGKLVGSDKVTSPASYQEAIKKFYESKADSVLAVYPLAPQANPRDAFEELLGDHLFHCNARRIARAVASSTPVWRYVFSHTSDSIFLRSFRAGHTLEIPYVFHNNGLLMGAREAALANTLERYWLNFAYSGDPNSEAEPVWPEFHGDEYLNLDIDTAAGKGFHNKQCDFWDTLGDKYGAAAN